MEAGRSAPAERPRRTPGLENGDHLSAQDFLRRFEALPALKKAELINGIVFMGSPVRISQHGEPDALAQTWLGSYAAATAGVKHAINTTTCLGPDDVPQPDGLLRIDSAKGGQSHLDANGYLTGAPELVLEIAASSVSIDTREKRETYRRAGVKEYLVWRTEEGEFDWWVLVENEYQKRAPAQDGIVRSEQFPGLWLNIGALLAGDGARVLGTLQEGIQSEEHKRFAAELAQR